MYVYTKMKLISWNIHAFPIFSDGNSRRLPLIRNQIEENISDTENEELVVTCIQEAWAYRTNIITYPFETFFFYLSKFNNTHVISTQLQRFSSEIKANDVELIGVAFTLLFRLLILLTLGILHIFNFMAFDTKDWLSVHQTTPDRKLRYYYNNGINNKSLPPFSNILSLFTLRPGFDSGCMIMSNKPVTETGFELWETWGIPENHLENMAHKGMVWCYFKDENALVITFHMAGASAPGTYEKQFQHLVKFVTNKIMDFKNKYNNDAKVYIFGDTNTEFDKEPQRLKIMTDAGFTKKSNTETTLMRENKEIDVLFTNTTEEGNTQVVESELSDHKMIMWTSNVSNTV